MNMAETNHLAGLRGELRFNEPMAEHVSWRAGGRAARAYIPADLADLVAFFETCGKNEPVYIVGLGSNLLVRDGGVRGTVVLLHSGLKQLRLESREAGCAMIYAEAGMACPKVARFAATHDLHGAEFLAGIPGTVGGALAMNAGCYGSETWEIVAQVLTLRRDGTLSMRTPADYRIGYRSVAPHSKLEEWFAAAWFRLPQGDSKAAKEKIRDLLKRRIASQPLELPNAGSVFRNPQGVYAARLIEQCGLKGLRFGGAEVSAKHANFIVNTGGATAADIEALIQKIQLTVAQECGIKLETEVRIIGEA
ncbi:MAG TPA: UDP-N-acetylmuramate dehydrogenase [Burkholderiales bacterium]|nr:UDP-N-acetylmuramate dehydrogenase [Burkholderiales bacterium]